VHLNILSGFFTLWDIISFIPASLFLSPLHR